MKCRFINVKGPITFCLGLALSLAHAESVSKIDSRIEEGPTKSIQQLEADVQTEMRELLSTGSDATELKKSQARWAEMVSEECKTSSCTWIATFNRSLFLKKMLNDPVKRDAPTGLHTVEDIAEVQKIMKSVNSRLDQIRWGLAVDECPVLMVGRFGRGKIYGGICSLSSEDKGANPVYITICQENLVGYFAVRAEKVYGTTEESVDEFSRQNCAKSG